MILPGFKVKLYGPEPLGVTVMEPSRAPGQLAAVVLVEATKAVPAATLTLMGVLEQAPTTEKLTVYDPAASPLKVGDAWVIFPGFNV